MERYLMTRPPRSRSWVGPYWSLFFLHAASTHKRPIYFIFIFSTHTHTRAHTRRSAQRVLSIHLFCYKGNAYAMHFSTSAALATLSALVGQTLADCTPGSAPFSAAESGHCSGTKNPRVFNCNNSPGATATQIGDTDQVRFYSGKGSRTVNYYLTCLDDPSKFQSIHCTPDSTGTIALQCPRGILTIQWTAIIRASP